MSAEDKLKEAKYFLDILKKISRTITADSQWKEGRDVHAIEPIVKYNFNACLQALISVSMCYYMIMQKSTSNIVQIGNITWMIKNSLR